MKVLIVGSGGREHALAWKLAKSDLVKEVLAAPGNVGIETEPKCRIVNVSADDIMGLKDLAKTEKIDLTIVGPEAPLVDGLADTFRADGLKVFGPSREAAMLEGSKVFAKEIMAKYHIPTAGFQVFDDYRTALAYVQTLTVPVAIKADGLAAGKGVFVCHEREQAVQAIDAVMKARAFGSAGDRVIVEECLFGEEASFIAFTDGKDVLPCASSQDHKPVFDEDQGPNTGGMGAYSPAPVVTAELHDQIMNTVMIPMVQALNTESKPYVGFLYAGLMIKDGTAKVLEFNARMGDPEAQPLVFRMKGDPIPVMMAAVEGGIAGLSIEWEPEDSICVVMASGGYPGSYDKGKIIAGIEEADKMDGVKVFHAGTGRENNRFVTKGGRVLGVTAKANGIGPAIQKAYEAVEKITWDGVHYRKDIGKKALDRD